MTKLDQNLIDYFTGAYIEAAYFTDTGDSEQPSSDAELATDALKRAQNDCVLFLEKILLAGLFNRCVEKRTVDSIAHDLWFSRNGHGTGFWDRSLGELGENLDTVAKSLGETGLYQGDDGFLYFY